MQRIRYRRFAALARHESYVQRCRDCGTVYSFTFRHRNQAPGFREVLPYVLAIAERLSGRRQSARARPRR